MVDKQTENCSLIPFCLHFHYSGWYSVCFWLSLTKITPHSQCSHLRENRRRPGWWQGWKVWSICLPTSYNFKIKHSLQLKGCLSHCALLYWSHGPNERALNTLAKYTPVQASSVSVFSVLWGLFSSSPCGLSASSAHGEAVLRGLIITTNKQHANPVLHFIPRHMVKWNWHKPFKKPYICVYLWFITYKQIFLVCTSYALVNCSILQHLTLCS